MIRSPKREWGEVRLASDGGHLLNFSHDSRHQNSPFTGLLQWVEEDWGRDSVPNEQFVRRWSTAGRWEEFFRSRIEVRAKKYRVNAAKLNEKASQDETRSALINEAL